MRLNPCSAVLPALRVFEFSGVMPALLTVFCLACVVGISLGKPLSMKLHSPFFSISARKTSIVLPTSSTSSSAHEKFAFCGWQMGVLISTRPLAATLPIVLLGSGGYSTGLSGAALVTATAFVLTIGRLGWPGAGTACVIRGAAGFIGPLVVGLAFKFTFTLAGLTYTGCFSLEFISCPLAALLGLSAWIGITFFAAFIKLSYKLSPFFFSGGRSPSFLAEVVRQISYFGSLHPPFQRQIVSVRDQLHACS